MLIKYEQWLVMNERSPLTAQRLGWGRMGTYPPRADFMSHSTPPPDIMNKMIYTFCTTYGKHKPKHKKHRNKNC